MKKKRLIVLLSILVIVAVIGCFTFIYRAAAAEKDAFYDYHLTDSEGAERLSRLPERIELESSSRPGYTVHFQDYSVTISGYEDIAIDNDLSDDFITVYRIGNDKTIAFEDVSQLLGHDLFNDPVISPQINKAAGKVIDNEYDFLEASFYCTPDDFSMLDSDKNKGVNILLDRKYNFIVDGCYQFDNGVFKGFIFAASGGALVNFSNCDAPDSWYQLIFGGFSTEEVKEMLSTITFGGSITKQLDGSK